MTQSQFTFS